MRVFLLFGLVVKELGETYVSEDELIAQSANVLSLHCPSTPETMGWLNAEGIAKMKHGPITVNVSPIIYYISNDYREGVHRPLAAPYSTNQP